GISEVRYFTMFSVSQNGLLVYATEDDSKVQWSWLGKDGKEIGRMGEPGDFVRADISPDGKTALMSKRDVSGGYSLWMYDIEHNGNDDTARFSEDGNWVAFESDVSGQWEVYLTQVKNPASHWQVSLNGGLGAQFCSGSDRFYYHTLDDQLMVVNLNLSGAEPHIGSASPALGERKTSEFFYLAPTRDCGRFLAGVR